MRKILIVLGLILMGAGCIVFAVGANVTTSNMQSLTNQMADPDSFCKPGEKLVTPEFSTPPAITTGSTSLSGFYYCVDDAGNRRDITQEFMQNMFGQMFSVLPTWATTGFTGMALFCLGLPILIVGAILSLRGQNRQTKITIPSYVDNPSLTLTERLRQLDEAYENGLISQDKYDLLRDQILDKMV